MIVPTPNLAIWNDETGYPTPGINATNFRIAFSRLPSVELFANTITLPQIELGVARQASPYLDMKQVGEKLVYTRFSIDFVLDSKLYNYKELYNWMKALSVQGLNSATISACSVLFDAGEFKFFEVFPVSIGSIEFDAKATDLIYPSCTVSFECDRYEIA